MMSAGSRLVKRRPTDPLRYFVRRSMPSAWASSGLLPRARAVSLVLPKKRLDARWWSATVFCFLFGVCQINELKRRVGGGGAGMISTYRQSLSS